MNPKRKLTRTPKKTKKEKSLLKKIAVVDIGSNSVRLVLYKRKGKSFSAFMDKKKTCRLAQNMKTKRPQLNRKGMALTLATLRQFKSVIKKNKATKVLAIATAAIRSVKKTRQGKDFHKKMEKALGAKIKIISGRKEAQLMALGVMATLPHAQGICGDFGGGSLELANIKHGKIIHTATINVGSLTLLSETRGDTILAEKMLNDRLRTIPWLTQSKGKNFYMIGGSWRAVGRVMMKKIGLSVRQVHGFTLNAPLAYALAQVIMRQKPSSFRRIHKKITQRADVLPIASATMAKIIERVQPAKIVFSGHGVREGLVRHYA